jgi:hypothetical protein
MTKEVNYVVVESMISPDKVIYAGTTYGDKSGFSTWRTRGEVTDMAISAVVRHFIAKTDKDISEESHGLKWDLGLADKEEQKKQKYGVSLTVFKQDKPRIIEPKEICEFLKTNNIMTEEEIEYMKNSIRGIEQNDI